MSATIPAGLDRHAAYNKTRLFLVSVLALFMAGVATSLRADVASDLQKAFFDPIDPAHASAKIAGVLALPFFAFALTIAIGSPLLDVIGMAFMLPLSGICFFVGTLLFLFTSTLYGRFLLITLLTCGFCYFSAVILFMTSHVLVLRSLWYGQQR